MTLIDHEQSLDAARAQILAEAGSWSRRERSSAARERAYQIAAEWDRLAAQLDPYGHPAAEPEELGL